MLNDICVFLGKLYVPCFKNKIVNVVEFECSKLIDESSPVFKKKLIFEKRNVLDIEWCSITSVFSHETKLLVIILLIQYKCHKICIYALESKRDLVEVSSFPCSPCFKAKSQLNIAVTDGPTVVCIQGPEICIMSVMFNVTETFTLQEYLPKDVFVVRILQFDSYECFYKQENLMVYIIILQSSDSSANGVHIFAILQILESGKFYNEMYDVPNHIFFPPYYQTIITAVHIIPCLSSRNLFRKQNEDNWDMKKFFVKNETIICTNKHFLVFKNGFSKHCCDIIMNDVSKIIQAPQSNPSENISYFLQSTVRGISFVTRKENSDKYECTETWENAVSVLFGDFLSNCKKQIVLLTNTEFESWQDDSLFLHCPSLTSAVISLETDVLDENMRKTIASLQNRVTYGKAAVVEAECRISQKSSVISNLLKGFRNQCSQNSLPGQSINSSLIDIMLYKDLSPQKCEEVSCETTGMALRLSDHWQLIAADHWFIGWVFQNVSNNCVANLSVSLILQEAEMEFRQRTFIDNSRDFSITKAEKRHALPNEKMTIIVCMKIPTFVAGDVEASCIVAWNIGVANNAVSDVLSPTEMKGPCQQQHFKVILKVQDVLDKDTFADCSIVYWLMSIRTLQDSIFVEIKSENVCLSVLESMIVQKQKKHPPKLFEIEATKCLCFVDERSSLYGINMSWHQLSKNKIEAEIYARTEKDLLLFIQWLYGILPRDIEILPKEFTQKEQSQLQKKLLTAMKDEVDFLRVVFATSDTATSKNNASSVPTSCNGERICDQKSSSDMRKAVIMKELVTDKLMEDFIMANYEH